MPTLPITFPTTLKEAPITSETSESTSYTDVQGYQRTLTEQNGITEYQKKIDDSYPSDKLLTQWNVDDQIRDKFREQFKEHRDTIMNYDEVFFFHYHQIASSIQASYQQYADKLKDGKGDDVKQTIQAHVNHLKDKVDEALNFALEQIQKECRDKFNEAMKENVRSDGSINIASLNKALDKSIKSMKKQSDKIFKDILTNANLPIYSQPARKSTNAFGQETLMRSVEDSGLTIEVQSAPITAHTKKKGPSVSSLVIKDSFGTVSYQAYRSSHLSSAEATPDEVRDIITQFMNKRFDAGKPMVYSLLTSVYSDVLKEKTIDKKNQQTKRLATLMDAQDAYNENKEAKDCFFTFNTPTNTSGDEITLESKNPLIRRVAVSNTIALAILLFGHENENVQAMISEYQVLKSVNLANDSRFSKALNTLTALTPNFAEGSPQAFLFERLKDGKAATHEHAKTVATAVGVVSGEDKNANLIVGCKSGLERTGNIFGRVVSYFRDKTPGKTPNIENVHHSYNEKGLYSGGTFFLSGGDQGGPPKTQVRSDSLQSKTIGNTNETEDPEVLTNYHNKGASKLQAHKGNFDNNMAYPKKIWAIRFLPYWLGCYVVALAANTYQKINAKRSLESQILSGPTEKNALASELLKGKLEAEHEAQSLVSWIKSCIFTSSDVQKTYQSILPHTLQ